jgi:hypothetical protein
MYYPRPTALNIVLEEKPIIIQNEYNFNSIYELNIDGLVEYQIISLLQQKTMVSNAYKTQTSICDIDISELLVADFTCHLKG